MTTELTTAAGPVVANTSLASDGESQRPEGSEPRGLLHTEQNCPAGMEAEFHAWYNTEHLPERMSIAGFLSARRYTTLEGEPRWLALYELESPAVLESPEYLFHYSGPARTSWTTRVMSLVLEPCRSLFTLTWSQRAPATLSDGHAEPRGLLTVRYDFPPERAEAFGARHDTDIGPTMLKVDGVVSARRYRCGPPASDQLVLYELASPWVVQSPEFLLAWSAGWESVRPMASAWKRRLYVRIR